MSQSPAQPETLTSQGPLWSSPGMEPAWIYGTSLICKHCLIDFENFTCCWKSVLYIYMLYMGNTFQIFQAPWYQPSEAAHEATDTLFPGPRLATIRRPYHWKRLILAAKLLPAMCRGEAWGPGGPIQIQLICHSKSPIAGWCISGKSYDFLWKWMILGSHISRTPLEIQVSGEAWEA